MNSLSARRRHRLAAFAVLLVALATTGGLYAAFAPADKASASFSSSPIAIEEGKKLFITGCSTCHGINAEGTSDGPSLIGVGAAAVDFQVMTGRMPLEQPGAQAPRKEVVYTQAESDQIAAYIASLAPGPAIPTKEQYEPTGGNQAEGGVLFRTNCASCHNFAGEGGALTEGKYAPSLVGVTPKHLYEAMLTGPQNMPSFPDSVLPPEKKKDIIAFLTGVTEEPNPGGAGLGRLGPVAEGLFLWIFGMGALIAASIWVGAHTSKAKKTSHE